MSEPELNSRTIKLRLPSLDTMKKLGKLGSALGSLGGVVALLVYIQFFEPQITPKTNLRIDNLQGEVTALQISLIEKTKGVPSDNRILEIEGKTSTLARMVDTKAGKQEMHDMEIRLMNAISESARETARLVVASLAKNKNGRAE